MRYLGVSGPLAFFCDCIARFVWDLVGNANYRLSCDTAYYYMSRVRRKPTFCICENKDADQLRGYSEADQRLCFRYIDSAFSLLSKSKKSSLYLSSLAVFAQHGLYGTWSETQKKRLSCDAAYYYIMISVPCAADEHCQDPNLPHCDSTVDRMCKGISSHRIHNSIKNTIYDFKIST